MKPICLIGALALAALTVPPAHAEMYKCQQPDGKTTFQDQPCQGASSGGRHQVVVTPPSSDAAASAGAGPARRGSQAQAMRDLEARVQRTEAELKARNAQAEANQRAGRCNAARRNLGVLKTERPVYEFDHKGDRKYLDDSARQAGQVAARREIAESCN